MANNFNSSYINIRKELLNKITNKNSIVLDIGCSNGANGKYLLENNLAKIVDGVEFDSKMGDVARKNLNSILIGSIEDEILIKKIPANHYDYIILGDVLEHLINPESTINQLKQNLHTNGQLIVSLPNIQHIDVFIHIFIKGTFPVNERGIFDKTHFHFFTKKNILTLFKKQGFKIDTLERVYRYRDAIGSKFPFLLGKILKKLFPNYYTYQYIIVCSKD